MGYGPWGLGFWELLILAIVFASFFRPRDSRRFDRLFEDFSSRHTQEKATYEEALDACEEDLEAAEARIDKLEERIRVLERIVTDEHRTGSLEEEIDNLRRKA